jgi:hypothetical protein
MFLARPAISSCQRAIGAGGDGRMRATQVTFPLGQHTGAPSLCARSVNTAIAPGCGRRVAGHNQPVFPCVGTVGRFVQDGWTSGPDDSRRNTRLRLGSARPKTTLGDLSKEESMITHVSKVVVPVDDQRGALEFRTTMIGFTVIRDKHPR